MEGKIQGIFEEIDDKNFKLVQKWKFDDWSNFSDVVIQIKDYDDNCKVTVI
jgi:activator of HSP90 ATPase